MERPAAVDTASVRLQGLEDQVRIVMDEWEVPGGVTLLILKENEVIKEYMTQQAQTTSSQLEGFEDVVRTIMEKEKVPGAAVLLLQEDSVLFSQGFGKRNVARNLDVTPRTLFPIGSCGKAFTAAAAAMLVAEGKLEWDTPVRQYLPTFKMYDHFATERMTPRDLLTHRSGLPRHDLLWYRSRLSRKEMVERLAYLEPSQDFRAAYQYNNLMFATAGYLIEHVTGKTWEAFVTERILKPLGMHTSTISVHDLQQTGDYALPYMEIKGEVLEIPFYDQWQIIAPAGGINTNLEDVQHWLRFQLNQGKHGETQLLDASQLAQNHTPQTVIPANATHPMGNHPEFASWSYGMGWMIGSYKGHRMIQHGGAIDGFMALIVLLPNEHAGVAVFTNKGSTVVPYMIAFSACDRLLGVEATDWHERLKNTYEQLKLQQAKMEEEINKIEPVPGTQPSHPLEAYCGTYQHPGYGDVTITRVDEQLRFTYHDLPLPLTHIHYDIFEMGSEQLMFKTRVSFATGEKGEIESLAVRLEPAVKAQIFTRIADQKSTKPAETSRDGEALDAPSSA